METKTIEATFVAFLSTKFAIVLMLSFFMLFIIFILLIRYWSSIGPFFTKLINVEDPISATRWVMVVQVIISNLFVWGVWAIMCICDNMDNTSDMPFTMVNIPTGVVAIYGIANGVAGAVKVGQALVDNKSNTPVTKTTE